MELPKDPPKVVKPTAGRRALHIVGSTIAALIVVGIGINVIAAIRGNNIADEMERASVPLIDALEKYRAQKGTPPASLQDLVPTYIATLPTCDSSGKRAIVYYTEGGHYTLTCYTYMFNKHSYDSANKSWRDWD